MNSEKPASRRRAPGLLPFVLCAGWAFLVLFGLKAGVFSDVGRLAEAFIPSAPASRFEWGNLFASLSFLLRGHLSSVFMLAALAGAGWGLTAFIGRPPGAGKLDRVLLGLALGFAVLSLAVLGLGLAGLLFAPVGWCLAGACAFMAPKAVRLWGKERFRFPGLSPKTVPGVLLWALSAQLVAVLLLVFAASAVPDPFYDSSVYQLAVPQLFISCHKAVAMPNNAYACFPLAAPMISTLSWLISGFAGPRAWCFWTACMALLAVYNIGAREGRPEAGLAAAAGFAVIPVFAVNALWSGADVPLCFALLTAAVAAREAAVRAGGARTRWVLFCGLLLGLGFSIKLTAVFFAPWFFAACAAGKPGPGLRRAALFAAASAVFILPWLARNYETTGNPVYPYATRLFPQGRQWEAERLAFFSGQQSAQAAKSLGDVLRLPLLLSRGTESETFVGPALLALVPVAFLFAPPAAPFRAYGAFALLAFLSFAPLSSVMRYLLAGWALLFALVAMAGWEAEKRLRGAAPAVLLVLLVSGFFSLNASVVMWKKAFDPVGMLSGRESAREFLGRKLVSPYEAFARAAGERMPPGTRVLMAGDPRGLYWPRPFLAHSAYDTELFEEIVRSSRSAEEAAKRLKQAGAGFIFVNDAETARMKFVHGYPVLEFDAERMKIVGELWRDWLTPAARDRGLHLFAVERPSSPGRGPDLPLSFDETALRREYVGWTMMTWEGDARMSIRKEVK